MSIKANKDNAVFISNTYLQEEGYKASATITYEVNPTNGQSINLNGTVFIYKTSPAVANDVAIGASISASIDNLLTEALPATATYTKVGTNQIFIEYVTIGVIGNSYTIESNFTTVPSSLSGGIDLPDTDWTDSTPSIDYKLPMLDLGGSNIYNTIQTTNTSLITYDKPVAENDPVKVYNNIDGLVEGNLGTVTNTIDVFKTTANFLEYTSRIGTWTVTNTQVTSSNSGHTTTAAIYYDSNVLNSVGVTDNQPGADYGHTSLLSLFDNTQTITPRDFYSYYWIFRGVMCHGTYIRTTAYDYSVDYNIPAGSVVQPAGTSILVIPNIINDTPYPGNWGYTTFSDPCCTYWANKGYYQWVKKKSDNIYYWIPTQKGLDELNPRVSTSTSSASFTLGLLEKNGYVYVVVNNIVTSKLKIGGTLNRLTKIAIQDQDYVGAPVWNGAYKMFVSIKYEADITSLGLLNPPTKAWLDKPITISTVTEATENRCIAQDETLDFVSSTSTEYVGTNSKSGLLTTYDKIQLNGANDVVCSNVVESNISTVLSSTHDIFKDGSAVATYQLNGNANDLGGNYNGTATNITYEEGKFGQAAKFNGSSSYINNFNLPDSTNVSISTLVKLNVIPSLSFVYGQCNSGGVDVSIGVSLALTSSGLRINQNGITSKDFNFTFATGVWYHIVHIVDGTLASIYVNNTLIGTHNFSVNRLPFNNTNFAFGKLGAYVYYFNGSIDQVRIFNRALTKAEVGTLYNKQIPKYQYTCTIPTQTLAPTSAKVLDRSVTSTEVSDTYDNVNDKFIKAYNKNEQGGRAFKYKIEADEGVEITKVNIEMNKGA